MSIQIHVIELLGCNLKSSLFNRAGYCQVPCNTIAIVIFFFTITIISQYSDSAKINILQYISSTVLRRPVSLKTFRIYRLHRLHFTTITKYFQLISYECQSCEIVKQRPYIRFSQRKIPT